MKSYFKFLSRNKAYTFINIAGLVVSLMFIILMGDYTWRQYSIDSWHEHADRIYLMWSNEDFFMWPQVAGEVKEMCPEVEKTCCVMSQNGRIKYGQREVMAKENDNSNIMLVDSTFFQFFSFPLVQGNPQTVLDAPDKCVVTESLARQLFGDKNPIGETLQIVGDRNVYLNNQDPYDSTLVYTISGVARDFDHTVLPNETQLIVSMERFGQVMGYNLTSDAIGYGPTGYCKDFLMLKPGTSLDGKKKTIEDYLSKNYTLWGRLGEHELELTPLTDIMFAPQNNGHGIQKGDRTRLRILLAAVLAILFFAVSNYINLTVANTGFRAKEMATRRLFGSSQVEISLKLIAESTLMMGVAFLIGFALALCFQDDAAELFKGKIALLNDISIGTVSISLAFILLVGIASGIMPSWHISRFQPIDIVKGNFRYHSKMVMGKLFIIIQNIVTVTMLTAALVIWLQVNHLIHAPLGFNTKHLYYIMSPEGKSQTVRNQLERLPFVETIGEMRGTSFSAYNSKIQVIKNGDELVTLFLTDLDSAAFNLYGLEILKDYGPTNGGYYLNEEAIRRLKYTDREREIDWWKGQKVPISGILKDFNRINVLEGVQPFAIRVKEHVEDPTFLVKTNGDKQAKAAFINILSALDVPEADQPENVSSLEENIAESFDEQHNTLKIITLFTIIAVIISVMGYVGMSLFFIRQRQKEIGIRKIMGSTSGEVMILMLRIFCAPLLISFIIAIPLSWYIMRDWLGNFSYRIELSAWIFVATCAIALLVAILSVSLQIIKAVRTNPVESIKTE